MGAVPRRVTPACHWLKMLLALCRQGLQVLLGTYVSADTCLACNWGLVVGGRLGMCTRYCHKVWSGWVGERRGGGLSRDREEGS